MILTETQREVHQRWSDHYETVIEECQTLKDKHDLVIWHDRMARAPYRPVRRRDLHRPTGVVS